MPKKKIKNKKRGILFLYCIVIFLIDQLIKSFILSNFLAGQSLPVIKSVFHLTLVFNKGGAFGMFTNAASVFIFASVLAILAISVSLSRKKLGLDIKIALASVMAGAISNLADRLRFGCVVDFLDFRIWPVFNIADSAITVGTLWLLWRILTKGAKDASGSV